MKKHRDKTESDDAEKTSPKIPQKKHGIPIQDANLEQRKKVDLKPLIKYYRICKKKNSSSDLLSFLRFILLFVHSKPEPKIKEVIRTYKISF